MEFFNDVGADPLKPSLFELIAQEQLKDLLQPSLKYVLAVISQLHFNTQANQVNLIGLCSALSALSFANCERARGILCRYYVYCRTTLPEKA
jgi:hypothetical protein